MHTFFSLKENEECFLGNRAIAIFLSCPLSPVYLKLEMHWVHNSRSVATSAAPALQLNIFYSSLSLIINDDHFL